MTHIPSRVTRIIMFTVLIAGQYCEPFAQPTFDWDKTFGGESYEELNALITVSDGIVTAGSSKSNIAFGNPADYTWNILVVKFDFSGNEIWRRYYGGNGDDRMWNMIATADGGFLVGGFSYSGISGDKTEANRGDKDVWILRLNAQGLLLWDKTYGALFQDELFSMIEKPGGTGFYLGCHSNSNAANEKTDNSRGGQDFWLIETDALGNKLWDATIGGSNYEQIHDIKWSPDGNILISGGTNSDPNSGEIGSEMAQGSLDFILYKFDPLTKSILWMHRYGGTGGDFPYALLVASSGKIYMGGGSNSNPVATPNGKTSTFYGGNSDFWLIELDGAGTKLREWGFGGTGLDDLYCLEELVMGQIVIGGVSDSDISGNKTTAALGGYDMWFIGLDMNGVKSWETTVGGTDHDAPTRITILPNGEWVLGGHSQSDASFLKTENSLGYNDFWLLSTLCNFENTIQPTIPAPCSGLPNILVAPMNGCSNCGYAWSTGSTFSTVTLAPGTIDTVRLLTFDTYGCFDYDSIIIKPDSLLPNIGSTAPVCAPNLQTYSVQINSDAGTLSSSAGNVVNNGNNTFSITNVPTGTNVTLTATNTTTVCEKTFEVISPLCPCTTVTPPLNPINSISCEGTVIPPLIVTPSAGTTVNWFSSATGGTSLGATTDFLPIGVFPAGVYTFYAEAQDNITNCPSTPRIPVLLTRLAAAELISAIPICAPNLLTYSVSITSTSASINSSSGIISNNGNGSFTISNIPTGTDIVIDAVHPTTNCPNSINIVTPVCPCPTVALPTNPNNPSACFGDPIPTLSVQANANTSIHWYNTPSGGISLATGLDFTPTGPLGAGSYSFYSEAQDSTTNCASTGRLPVILTIYAPVIPPTNPTNPITCEGEDIPTLSVSGSPNIDVIWFDISVGGLPIATGNNFTPLGSFSSGIYTFYTEAQNTITNCKSTTRTPVTLTINSLPTLTTEPPMCAPDLQTYSIMASSNDGNILSSNGTVANIGDGNYLVSNIPVGGNVILTAVNSMNCQSSQLFASPLCPCPIVAKPTNANNPTICLGATIPALSVTSEANTSVYWFDTDMDGTILSTGSEFNLPTNLPSGTYTYYAEAHDNVTDCISDNRLPVTLTIKPQTIGGIAGNNQICTGSNSILTASGGTNIQWSTAQTTAMITVMPLITSSYTAIVSSNGSCPDTVGIVVQVGQTIQVNTEQFTCDPALAGITTQSFITASGCDSIITNTITLSNSIGVVATALLQYGQFAISCADLSDGVIESTVSGGVPPFAYQWNTGQTTTDLQNIGAGTYTLTVTDERGCTGTDTAWAIAPEPIKIQLEPNTSKCGDAYALLNILANGNNPPFSITINEEISSTQPVKLEEGQHLILIQDANGCTTDSTIIINIPDPPLVSLPNDTTIIIGQTLDIEAIISDPTITTALWNPVPDPNCPNCLNQTWQPLVSTRYIVKVTAQNGCTGTAIMTVRVSRDIDLYIPNVFSPNNDGSNDEWILGAGDDTIILKEMAIFDRWGNQVYAWNNPTPVNAWAGWDGIVRNKLANQGVYTYYLNIQLVDGEIILVTGTLTLI